MTYERAENAPGVGSSFIGDIEVIRGVSIVLVLIAHLPFLVPSTNQWHSYVAGLTFGVGVDLFFIISGFVISRSLARDIRRRHSFTSAFRVFWIRRIFRLWPAAFVSIAATLLVVSLLGHTVPFSPYGPLKEYWISAAGAAANVMNVVGYWTIASGGHGNLLFQFWSLSLEEQFYLCLPFAMLLLPTPRKLLVLSVAVIAVVTFLPRENFFRLFWWIRIDGMFWGVLIYCLLEEPKILPFLRNHLSRLGGFPSILIFLAGLALMVSLPSTPIGYTGKQVAGAILVAIAALNTHRFEQFGFASRAFMYLGRRAYTIYLWHCLCFVLLQLGWLTIFPEMLAEQSVWMVLPLILSAAVLVPVIEFAYHCIEVPARNIGRKLADRSQPACSTTVKVST